MRIDQLYNVGGYDPEHPSGNVLDELAWTDTAAEPGAEDPTVGVTARHYDGDGNVVDERPLTSAEVDFFFGQDTTVEDRWAVHQLADARMAPFIRTDR